MNTLRKRSPGPPAPSPRNKRYQTRTLWHRLLGGSRGAVSENGRLRHRDGDSEGGNRCRRGLVLTILLRPAPPAAIDNAAARTV